ncbi:MAG: type II secretion system F family protein [Patescibacteria group bacterium UBA2163]
MKKFRVTALTGEKEKYTESIEAEDRFAVYTVIRDRGDKVVSLQEDVGITAFLSSDFIAEALHSISDDEKVVLTRNLAAMLEAGLTTSRALGVMSKQTKNPRLKSILGDIILEVQHGGTLSSGFSKFKTVFSPLLISMVRAGEESGKLSESLRVVATQMDQSNRLKKKIRGALMYPSIVLIAMVIIGILMLIYVVPTLTQTFNELGGELPATTKAVIAVSDFLAASPLLSLLILLITGSGIVMGLRTKKGKYGFDYVMLHLPVIKGLVMETNSARTTRTLSSLLSSGVDVVRSIAITRDVIQNSFYAKVLSEAEAKVVEGGSLSEIFQKYPNLYPPLVSEMFAVGEETGRLSSLLRETAEFYEDSVQQQTKDLSTIIEPFLMLIIGAAVGFFAISMIAPIYSLSSAI